MDDEREVVREHEQTNADQSPEPELDSPGEIAVVWGPRGFEQHQQHVETCDGDQRSYEVHRYQCHEVLAQNPLHERIHFGTSAAY